MLRVTCNNVVQQHLTVVQQLQQLSSTTITAKISREADTKKPTVLLVGLVNLQGCRLFGFSPSVQLQRGADFLGCFDIAPEFLVRCIAERVLKRGNTLNAAATSLPDVIVFTASLISSAIAV
jgi:hypothetical protein